MKQEVEKTIGIVIVTFRSSNVIRECLDSLLDAHYTNLRIVICDNASPDDGVDVILQWSRDRGVDLAEVSVEQAAASQTGPGAKATLLRSQENLGYAGAANLGLAYLMKLQQLDLFWVLNPDCEVASDAPREFARAADRFGTFGLMGGRTIYREAPNRVQSDGGLVSLYSGVCRSLNKGRLPDEVAAPDGSKLDFVSGANMLASRAFLDKVGLMEEDYFLYYEEVDWALRRGELPIVVCPDAIVYHHGGTAIGSGSISRRASHVSNYYNFRNRLRLVWRFNRIATPVAYAVGLMKAARLLLAGAWSEAVGALRGLHQLPPSAEVRKKISTTAPKSRAVEQAQAD